MSEIKEVYKRFQALLTANIGKMLHLSKSAGLKIVLTVKNSPNENLPFTHESRRAFKYFKALCLMARPDSKEKFRYLPIKKQSAVKLLFIITRIIFIAKVIYILLLLNKYFVHINGPLVDFDCFEVPGWLLLYSLILGPDLMGQNKFFIPSGLSSFDVMDSIWRKWSVSLPMGAAEKHCRSLRKSVKRIFCHFM